MLFAAGLGTRLRPLTDRLPKALALVDGKPLLAHTLARFAEHGLTRVVINTHHLGEQIETYLAAHSFPFEVVISREEVLLETGGGLVRALHALGEAPFFSANADTFWLDHGERALTRLEEAFDEAQMDALLLLHPLARAVGYRGPGNFALTTEGQLQRAPDAELVFTGLQVLAPKLLRGQTERVFSLRELYEGATRADGRLTRMHGLVHRGDWLHVGSPEELAEANAYCARAPFKT